MLLIYSNITSNRLRYISNFIFTQVLEIEIEFTDNYEQFENYENPKIAYTQERQNIEFWLHADKLLFETTIEPQIIEFGKINDLPILFANNKNSMLSFDIFAASFYLLTRYEEYLPFTHDTHSRFPAKESIAFKNNFLHLPIIELWSEILAQKIKEKFPGIVQQKKRKYTFLPTIDIDNAFAVLHKGFFRSTGSLLKSAAQFKLIEFISKVKTHFHLHPDLYDTYDFIEKIHSKYNCSPVIFILVGKYGKHDKNCDINNPHFRKLIKKLAEKYEIGIHPSYASNENTGYLKKEIEALSEICGKKITKSRQHYLKLSFPETYRELLNHKIEEDYSMGYPDMVSFRASTSFPHYFFNLIENKETTLKIVPFQIMDVTLNQYLKHTPEQSVEKIVEINEKIKNIEGFFVSLWHNESFCESGKWQGWQNVYENLLKNCSTNGS